MSSFSGYAWAETCNDATSQIALAYKNCFVARSRHGKVGAFDKFAPTTDRLDPDAAIIGHLKLSGRYVAWVSIFSFAGPKVLCFITFY